jgi:prevent-host-death family protein
LYSLLPPPQAAVSFLLAVFEPVVSRLFNVLVSCGHNCGYIARRLTVPEIGIRQLKNETSEILRAVREDKAEYVITYRGEPVAVLRPVEPPAADAEEILALAAGVFDGLGPDDLAEMEAAIRRRPDFFGETLETRP